MQGLDLVSICAHVRSHPTHLILKRRSTGEKKHSPRVHLHVWISFRFPFFNLPKNFSETQVSFLIMLTANVSVVFQASPPILEPTTALAIYSRMSSSLVPCNHLLSRHTTFLEETSCLVIQICGRNYCLLDKVDVGLAKK